MFEFEKLSAQQIEDIFELLFRTARTVHQENTKLRKEVKKSKKKIKKIKKSLRSAEENITGLVCQLRR